MRLGYYMGYAPPGTNPLELIALAQEAERLGYDSAWAAEAWGTDAVTVLSWLAATTTTLKVGSAIMQMPGRTPANTAMTAATLDLCRGGRFLLGLGTSGPQVVEGWHGEPWGKPLARTREYVEIVRRALRRETLEHDGEHYGIPYAGDGRDRARQAAEADGAAAARGHPDLPRGARPEERRAGGRDRGRLAADLLLARPLARGLRRREPRRVRHRAERADRRARTTSRRARRAEAAARALRRRDGLARRTSTTRSCAATATRRRRERIQELYLDGKQREAIAAVPDALVDEVALVGPTERIAERLDAWRESGVTTLLVRDARTQALGRWRSSSCERAASCSTSAARSRSSPAAGRGSAARWPRALAELGADLVLCARKAERCEQAAAELARLGVRALGLALRRRRPRRGQGVVARARDELGRIDILVNNAGTVWGAPPEDMPLEGWQKVVDVNLTGVSSARRPPAAC